MCWLYRDPAICPYIALSPVALPSIVRPHSRLSLVAAVRTSIDIGGRCLRRATPSPLVAARCPRRCSIVCEHMVVSGRVSLCHNRYRCHVHCRCPAHRFRWVCSATANARHPCQGRTSHRLCMGATTAIMEGSNNRRQRLHSRTAHGKKPVPSSRRGTGTT